MGWTLDDMPDQTGRTTLVTGANSGLGLCTAEALAAKGARVLLACRSEAKAAAALDRVKAGATGADPVVVRLDLADLGSVRACVAAVGELVDGLDVLINNAGIMAIPHAVTAEGFEMQFGTNHLGHFALTAGLLPLLQARQASRVVTTASNAHRMGRIRWDDINFEQRYRKWPAYGQSKLANLLFMGELDRRARAAGSDLVSVAAHPGYAATHLQFAGPELVGRGVRARVVQTTMAAGNRLAAQTAEMGSLPQLRAATAPDVVGGDYYGPTRLLQNRGYPKKVGMSSRARDLDAAARLWALSEDLTDTPFSF